MGRIRHGLFAVGIAGLTALGAAGCGGGDDGGSAGDTAKAPAAQAPAATTPAATTPAPASSGAGAPASDPVARAATVAARLDGGLTVKMTGTVSTNGQQTTLSGKGTVDRHSGRGMFDLTTGINGQDIPIREVMDGHTLYLSSKVFDGRLPGKRSWMKIDLREAAKTAGFDLSSLGTNGPSQDPSQVLDYLRGAGASKKVGTATIRGVQTVHYTADVDVAKARAATTSKAGKDAIKQLAKALGSTKSIPIDVWIDGQHRVLRERVRYTATVGSTQSGFDVTTDFVDFDAPVKVDPPPASDTVDGLALIKKSGALKDQGTA